MTSYLPYKNSIISYQYENRPLCNFEMSPCTRVFSQFSIFGKSPFGKSLTKRFMDTYKSDFYQSKNAILDNYKWSLNANTQHLTSTKIHEIFTT